MVQCRVSWRPHSTGLLAGQRPDDQVRELDGQTSFGELDDGGAMTGDDGRFIYVRALQEPDKHVRHRDAPAVGGGSAEHATVVRRDGPAADHLGPIDQELQMNRRQRRQRAGFVISDGNGPGVLDKLSVELAATLAFDLGDGLGRGSAVGCWMNEVGAGWSSSW